MAKASKGSRVSMTILEGGAERYLAVMANALRQ